MLDWIQEQEDVWQRLQRCEKPIVMYGMGDGAVKILQVMKRYGIKIEAMFASDEFVRGHQFMGYQVEKLSDLQKRYDDFLIVMAFAVRDQPTVDRITELSKQYELVAPDVPVAGVNLFTMDFVQEHEEQLRQVEQLLADEQSRRVLHSIVNFKLSGKLEYLTECTTDPEEAYRCILKPTAEESFADLGAYRGDTIAELLHYARGCLPLSRTSEPTASCVRRWKRWALPTAPYVCRWRPIRTENCWNLTAGPADSRHFGRIPW